MHSSRFQLSLTSSLALGLSALLAWTLVSGDAIGYPSGPAVSLGSNPVFSVGGHPGASDTTTVLTAPSDQAAIVTDVAITAIGYNGSYACTSSVSLLDPDGTSHASYRVASNTGPYSNSITPSNIVQSFSSGVAVAPGDTLRISLSGNCTVSYTLSGYYAQP